MIKNNTCLSNKYHLGDKVLYNKNSSENKDYTGKIITLNNNDNNVYYEILRDDDNSIIIDTINETQISLLLESNYSKYKNPRKGGKSRDSKETIIHIGLDDMKEEEYDE